MLPRVSQQPHLCFTNGEVHHRPDCGIDAITLGKARASCFVVASFHGCAPFLEEYFSCGQIRSLRGRDGKQQVEDKSERMRFHRTSASFGEGRSFRCCCRPEEAPVPGRETSLFLL